jgi:hypothetical protein
VSWALLLAESSYEEKNLAEERGATSRERTENP